MDFDERERDALRPALLAQSARLRNLVAEAMEELREGRDALRVIHALVEGEEHLLLGCTVGTDFLSDSLLAAWEMYAPGKTVEEVQRTLSRFLEEGALPLLGSGGDDHFALGLLPYVSSLAGGIAMWGGLTPEEYAELARTWLRQERIDEDLFLLFAQSEGIPVESAVRGGLVLLAWLESLILESL